ncbi:bifunctional folylpolyglutamate synthase/dihydrofolate synthase [Subsaxibacter sp. CAU 1640]|uniref:bifunctional folylpolyglutamate synthase/dihydrofolate synthase n=1 Tax=Subsaxibacter sp. CAU 1640 TaxID=2933271 RepID=UPI002004868F|nr:folylpolyglutamate synthase/dihydrofolate synthase family protein [Subsaxibacter sp. CAU 1640]MCK7591844.1 bifunctional folylpolyglutamate synthase/dihydrofolate synthase [Subsaxibacter sp. CAU 1640]
MTYQDTVNWMFKQLPMYQNQGKSAYKANLDNTHLLADYLNHPENSFKSIHVAGTNGKGSTSHMLASILQEGGYKVGLYTSPHLKDFRERIKINGKEISEEFVVEFIDEHKLFFESNTLSFFEMTVGMAFDYFSKEKVDIAIIEVGMGGRLDSTNIITPEVSVITNIGLDHTQFLGSTLEAIAKEKGGIIKPNIPVVIGETQLETEAVFREISKDRNSKIFFADKDIEDALESDLKGYYQQKNIKTVLKAVSIIQNRGYHISDENIKNGLLNVVKNTGLNGRWQILSEHPKIICDTAHNKEGLNYVMQQLNDETFDKLHMVFGVVNDKELESILPILPKNAEYYFCKPNIPRGKDVEELQYQFLQNGFNGKSYSSVIEAFETAKENAAHDDLIYVGGSTFVVAEII